MTAPRAATILSARARRDIATYRSMAAAARKRAASDRTRAEALAHESAWWVEAAIRHEEDASTWEALAAELEALAPDDSTDDPGQEGLL